MALTTTRRKALIHAPRKLVRRVQGRQVERERPEWTEFADIGSVGGPVVPRGRIWRTPVP
jgi:hypothetical protein